MSRKSKLQRLEFINALQRVYNSILARQQLQSNQLISVVFEDRYNLSNPTDVGVLMSNLEYKIDDQLKTDLYDYLTTGIQGLVALGAGHSVNNSLNIMGDEAFDFLELGDRIGLNYINRVAQDGLRLSDRIWDSQQKDSINKAVFETIREGGTQYDLAKKIEEVVGSGVPNYRIKRIAETELTYAYSHAKADIVIEEAKLFKNAQAYIKISLSPAHPKPDICDLMAGTYKAEEAPLPPYHSHCLCETETILKPKSDPLKTTTIEKNIKTNPDLVTVKTVETHDTTVNLN